MPYTLLKFLLWFALAAVIGGVLGWLLRSLRARVELARVRAGDANRDELERLRSRVADFDDVVAERDRLRIKIADLRANESPGIVGAAVPDAPTTATPPSGGDAEDDHTENDDIENADVENDHIENDDIENAEDRPDRAAPETNREPAVQAGELDLAAAAAALGKPVSPDDLTAVEGIGPKISELCNGIGVTTWQALADTDVESLRSMLDAAGSRYQVHDPSTWPRQAALLASGRWEAFVEFNQASDDG